MYYFNTTLFLFFGIVVTGADLVGYHPNVVDMKGTFHRFFFFLGGGGVPLLWKSLHVEHIHENLG